MISPEVQAPALTVVTWNVHSIKQIQPRSLEALSAGLRAIDDQYRPDVYCLNEVVAADPAAVPALANAFDDEKFEFYYAPSAPEKHYTVGTALAIRSEMATLSLDAFKTGFDGFARFRRQGRYDNVSLHARLWVGSQAVNVIGTHLPHLVPYNIRNHPQQATALVEYVASLEGPAIVMGDLNRTTNMAHKLAGRLAMEHITSTQGPTWRPSGYELLPGVNYDHILHSPDLVALESAMLDRYPSDHAPLVARFALGASAQ